MVDAADGSHQQRRVARSDRPLSGGDKQVGRSWLYSTTEFVIRLSWCVAGTILKTSRLWNSMSSFRYVYFNIALVSAMPYLQYLDPGGGKEGNWHVVMEQVHNPAYHSPTYPLQIPHISLLCTECVEFTKNFPKSLNTTKVKNIFNLSELGQSRLSTNPLGNISKTNPPLFSDIRPGYAR